MAFSIPRGKSSSPYQFFARAFLLVPNAVLVVSAAVVAITFAGNWEMKQEQAQAYRRIVFGSVCLSFTTVLGFLFAGFYVAVAPSPESPALIHAGLADWVGQAATFLLAGGLGGLGTLMIRLGRLVRNRSRHPMRAGV